jgi:uncharacterized protein (TIGR03435 family)
MARTIAMTAVLALASTGVYGQAVTGSPHFEVASIKLAKPVAGGESVRGDPGRIDYRQIHLKELILRAYGVPLYQVVWPEWLSDRAGRGSPASSAYYDVVATIPAGTPKEQVPLMLRTLLAERLKLTVHREERDLPVYAMLVAKGGVRMHPAKREPGADPEAERPNVYSVSLGSPEARISGEVSPGMIANSLRYELDRPMVDLTGLEGNFEIDLRWAHQADPPPGRGAPESASTPTGGNTAALFAAMEKQLGIHVEPRKVPTEMLVIDQVERIPTDN